MLREGQVNLHDVPVFLRIILSFILACKKSGEYFPQVTFFVLTSIGLFVFSTFMGYLSRNNSTPEILRYKFLLNKSYLVPNPKKIFYEKYQIITIEGSRYIKKTSYQQMNSFLPEFDA